MILLSRQSDEPTPKLCRLLFKVIMEPHFDCVCMAWYPKLTGKLKMKVQKTQQIYVRSCIEFDKMHHISEKNINKINLVAADKSLYCCVYKVVSNTCRNYMKELFNHALQYKRTSRSNFAKVKEKQTFGRTVFPKKNTSSGKL